MIYTPKIEKAIQAASLLHKDQVRKGKQRYPYTTHLFSVMMILSEYTDDEDVLVAGLLHDSLEDTAYTADELEQDFGSRVRNIVEGVTEDQLRDDKKIDWATRKKEYALGLEDALEGSLYVSAVDKIHNFTSILDVYKNDFEEFKKDFESADRIHLHEAIVEVIERRLGKEHPLVERLQKVFAEYKSFLESVYN